MSPQSTIKGLVKGFQGLARGHMAVHETIHTRLFEQPAPTDIRPVEGPTNESGPYTMTVFADARQMVQTLSTKLQRRCC
jgi:hypothetical protein